MAAVTIGSDPEFFFRSNRTGTVVPIIGLLGGTKGKPEPIPGLEGEGWGMQEDNVMAEFNIPPVQRANRFAGRIINARDRIVDFVRTKRSDLVPDIGGCARVFSFADLDNKQAQTFGCSPDFDAHREGAACPGINTDALREEDGEWRFAGGHVHIGYESSVPDFVAAAMCDVYLGLPSVAMDKQGKRRELYGSAGRYRPTTYGIEYRTLSNFWIWDDHLAAGIGQRALAVGALLQGDEDRLHYLFSEIPWLDVTRAINEEDEQLAADLIMYCTNSLEVQGL